MRVTKWDSSHLHCFPGWLWIFNFRSDSKTSRLVQFVWIWKSMKAGHIPQRFLAGFKLNASKQNWWHRAARMLGASHPGKAAPELAGRWAQPHTTRAEVWLKRKNGLGCRMLGRWHWWNLWNTAGQNEPILKLHPEYEMVYADVAMNYLTWLLHDYELLVNSACFWTGQIHRRSTTPASLSILKFHLSELYHNTYI